MIVFNPLSLYTTYLGWQVYDVVFEAFYQTGIWFLGFAFVVFRYFKNAFAPSGATHHAGEHALNHFLYELLVLIVSFAIFIYPTTPLGIDELKFKPMCSIADDATIGHSNTTYDDALYSLLSSDVKVPLGFSILQNFTSSLTYGLMKSVPCVDGLNNIKSEIVSIHLPRKVRQEVTSFQKQCFMEARLKFTTGKPKESEYQATLKQYGGETDLKWIGSHVLRELYYGDLKAREPVNRYSYKKYPSDNFKQAAGDGEGEVPSKYLPEHGFPDCEVWWVDIRQSLVDLINDMGFVYGNSQNQNLYKRVEFLLTANQISGQQNAPNDELAHDLIARTLIENNSDIITRGASLKSSNNSFQRYAASLLNGVGQNVKSWTTTPLKREAIAQSMPVMQAITMFFVIVLMPFVIGFSGCSPRAIGAFAGIITVLIVINFLWFLVGMIEMKLVDTLEGNSVLISFIQNTAVLFYYIAPFIFLNLSALWGAGSAAKITSMVQEGKNNAEDAANAGYKTGEVAGKGAAKAATKGFI